MDIRIGESFDANTPLTDILNSIRLVDNEPEPVVIIDNEAEPQNLGQYNITLTKAQAMQLSNMTVEQGKRWAMAEFGIEDDYAAYTVTAAGIGMHRALADLGLLIDYKIQFEIT